MANLKGLQDAVVANAQAISDVNAYVQTISATDQTAIDNITAAIVANTAALEAIIPVAPVAATV